MTCAMMFGYSKTELISKIQLGNFILNHFYRSKVKYSNTKYMVVGARPIC